MSSGANVDPLLTIRLPRVEVERLDKMRRWCAASTPLAARGGTTTNRNTLFKRALDLLEAELREELGIESHATPDDAGSAAVASDVEDDYPLDMTPEQADALVDRKAAEMRARGDEPAAKTPRRNR